MTPERRRRGRAIRKARREFSQIDWAVMTVAIGAFADAAYDMISKVGSAMSQMVDAVMAFSIEALLAEAKGREEADCDATSTMLDELDGSQLDLTDGELVRKT